LANSERREHNKGEKNRARKPKTSTFKKILGLREISRFLEVDETSPPLCNLLISY